MGASYHRSAPILTEKNRRLLISKGSSKKNHNNINDTLI